MYNNTNIMLNEVCMKIIYNFVFRVFMTDNLYSKVVLVLIFI
jgi:hypothetical protein